MNTFLRSKGSKEIVTIFILKLVFIHQLMVLVFLMTLTFARLRVIKVKGD